MPITDTEGWNECVANNQDGYGGACVNVARRVMEILDEEPGEFDCHKLICQADRDVHNGQGELTGFMAGAVASMVGHCHSRGDEFRRKWNLDNQIHDEGEKANESGGTLNPALVEFTPKEG